MGHGERQESAPGIAPALFYGLVGLLMLTNALAIVAFLMSGDIARIVNGHSDRLVMAYEDRITQLRVELDRLQSRSFAQAGDINLQLQEVWAQQELLTEQHEIVRALVGRAADLGIEPAVLPQDLPLDVGAQTLASGANPDIRMTGAAIAHMMAETRLAMAAISEAATSRSDVITSELGGLGIPVVLPHQPPIGMGGPLLPPIEDGAATELLADANAVLAALHRFEAAQDALGKAPVHVPITGDHRQSSGFGNRRDPFTGSRAFHAGLDFAAPTGTAILSAGAGRVAFAGTRSGYGKLVEIAHANGLVTRYAHMSAILVRQGQSVPAGLPIGRVGSTGRSTGPHLHFEVRKGDAALDPKTFLEAGRRLQQMI